MSRESIGVSPELQAYAIAHGMPPDEVQRDLIEETSALGDAAGMQISPEQGALMTLLTRIVGARRAVEVGTFTGYSSLCIARGLAEGGRLLGVVSMRDVTGVFGALAPGRITVEHEFDALVRQRRLARIEHGDLD